MTHEEKVLEVLELLKKAKVERKEIEKEIEKLGKEYEEYEVARKKERAEIDALRKKVFNNKYVKYEEFGTERRTVEISPYYDENITVQLYKYSFLGMVLEGDYKTGKWSTERVNIFNSYHKLKDLSEEEVVEKIKKDLKEDIEFLEKTEKSLVDRLSIAEKKLASLEAELSITPAINVFARMSLKRQIKFEQENVAKLKKSIENCKKEIAVSKTSEYEQKYVEERLEIFKQIKEDMALYLQREREFNEKYNSDDRRDFHAEESKLKYKLSEVKKNEETMLKSLLSSESVAVLVKIAKDPKVDEETREMAKKVLKFIADQRKEKNTNKR